MPLLQQTSVGSETVTPSVINTEEVYNYNAVADNFTDPLYVEQLPNLVLWYRQMTPNPPGFGDVTTFTLQGAIGTLSAGPPPTPDFFDLGTATVATILVHQLQYYRLPVNFIRLKISTSSGNATQIQIKYAAYGP
jgi:hypothetical protein